MSRRRGEFEHRTSIFEGAFRAWSYLGGLDPTDLETKTLAELDPLTPEAEERSRQDPRLKSSDFSQLESPSPPPDGGGAGKNGTKRRIYPYEPLPRSGLAHPFVQAILSPWLGSEAEQNAIQLGLTTLRTWWQHRRKGESGSAISALGTDKMRGVVEGYTRHFFSLAYCLVTNDGEQPPRTLHTKMKDLEKARAKKYKKRAREEEAGKLAALALNAGLAHGLNVSGAAAAAAGAAGGGGGSSSGVTPNLSDLQQQNATAAGQLGGAGAGAGGGADGVDDSHLSPLERLALAHQRQQQQTQIAQGQNVGGPPIKTPQSGVINLKGKCVPGKLDLQQLALQMSAQGTQVMHAGGLTSGSAGGGGKGGNMVQPDHLNSASNMALAGAGAAAHAAQYGGVPNANPNAPGYSGAGGGGDDEDSGTTPVVLVSPKGDIQIAMSVDGITCAHCVKIVETVLRGCNGNKSPINGLLDAAADHDLCAVIIKIDKSSNAKRVAREAARNLAMVGYTGKVKEMSIADMGTGGGCCGTNGGSGGNGGGKYDFQTLNAAFDVVAAQDPVDVFDWTIPCTCPDNGVVRQDCKRHAQINQRILQAFEQRAARVTEFVVGCGKKYGRECTCGPNCRCKDGEGCCAKQQQGAVGATAAVSQQHQNQHNQSHPIHAQGPGQGMSHPSVPQHAALHSQMELSQAQIAEHLTATAAAAAGGRGRSSRNNSMISRGTRRASGHSETFGRAMSGLSQLSIDWENMEDFDVDVDHSAHIDNSYPGGGASQVHGRPVVGGIIEESAEGGMNMEDRTDGIMAGCGMMNGGDCTCGPTCFCVGCPIHDSEKSEPIAGGTSNFGTHGSFFGHGGAFGQGTFGPGGDAIRRRSSLRKRGTNTSDAAQVNMQVSFKM